MTSNPGTEAEAKRLLVVLQPRLLWYFASRVADEAAQNDLLGTVNERMLRRIKRGDVEKLEHFAFGVARHVLHEYWRDLERRRSTEVELGVTAANHPVPRDATTVTGIRSRGWLLGVLRDCIDQLAETEREFATRCYAEGTSKENRAALASELGVTRNVIDARISRTRAKLERCVQARLEARRKRDEERDAVGASRSSTRT